MTGPTKKQLEFLRVIGGQKTPVSARALSIILGSSTNAIAQRLKFCHKNDLVATSYLEGPDVGWILSEAGKRAINGHAYSHDVLAKGLERLTFAWPFHLHEVNLGNGYGADIHNKYDRPVASFRNIDRAKAFMAVLTELLKQDSKNA